MFDNGYLQVGAGRYHQSPGALAKLGAEAACWGKKAYIVTDHTVWAKTAGRVEESLKKAGVDYHVDFNEMPSTQRTFQAVADRGTGLDTDIYIGLGGGRVIDIAKGASVLAKARVITAPTSPTNCAAYAVLYVTYGEDGFVEKSQWLQHEISAVLVDTDIAVLDCPVRYLATGIADAMAKKPEFIFTMLRLGTDGETATSALAVRTGAYNYDLLMKKARQAVRDAKNGLVTSAVDDVVCTCLMLTGMVSDLSTGGKQLAIAHNFYDAVCGLRPDVRRNFLHGELVGLSIPLQMFVNGDSAEEIEEFKQLMRDIGVPVRLGDVGIGTAPADLEELIQCTYRKTVDDDPVLLESIRRGFEVLF